MQQRWLFLSAIVLSNIGMVAGQAATTTSNPLDMFIGAAGAAASVVRSAQSKEAPSSTSSSSISPSPTPPPAAATPSHTAAPAHHGLSSGAKIGIIVGAVVAALLILAILGLLCCCLIRRRRKQRRISSPPVEREAQPWKSPINPGRHYSNYTPAQQGHPMEQSPTVPLMAAAATEHHRANHSQAPSLSQHPAIRQGPENPFVPVPPSPRKTAPDTRTGSKDSPTTGTVPYAMHETQHPHNHPGPLSSSRPNSSVLPTHADTNRPPTPFGLSGFGTPAGQKIHNPKDTSPPYGGIGQPYEDMHVHILRTDAPSRDLRQSLNAKETAGLANAAYDSDEHTKFRTSRGYSTPPEVPSRSPHREKRASMFADSSYDSSLSNTTPSSNGAEQYGTDPYALTQRDSMAPWEQHQRRFSNSPRHSAHMTAPPPIPWEESEYNANRQRHQSHSPRQSGQYDRRRSSRSPATSINGQPRRLRFEDLHSNGGHSYNAIPNQHGSYDGYDSNHRESYGVGEAL